jgi:PTH1 family peptidyl-tRNA hydrolase
LGGIEAFGRVRVGIGRTGPAGADLTGHVLGKFAAAERTEAEAAVDRAAEAVACCLKEGLTAAMNQFNRKTKETRVEEDKP